MYRTIITINFIALLIIFSTAGCDQEPIPETTLGDNHAKSFPAFKVISGSSLSPESDQARDLRGFLEQNHEISYGNVIGDQLKLMKMRIEGSSTPVDVVVAPLRKSTLSTSPISVPSKEGNIRELMVDYSQFVYIPSSNKGFTTDWHFDAAERKAAARRNGFVRFSVSGNQFKYRVSSGWPVKQVATSSDPFNLSKRQDDEGCLDGPNCSTAKCYKTAKDACDSDSGCKLLCDALDLTGGACTISIAAACVYLNVIESE